MSDFRAMNVVDSFVLAVGGTAVTLASATPPLVNGRMSGKTVRRMVVSNIAGSAVYWRADGAAPVAGSAHILEADGYLSFTGANYKSVINAIQFIQVAASATIFGTMFD